MNQAVTGPPRAADLSVAFNLRYVYLLNEGSTPRKQKEVTSWETLGYINTASNCRVLRNFKIRKVANSST